MTKAPLLLCDACGVDEFVGGFEGLRPLGSVTIGMNPPPQPLLDRPSQFRQCLRQRLRLAREIAALRARFATAVHDYERVLRQVETSPWSDGRVVLFGGSEGGAAVSMLAPRITPTATVVFSAAPGR